MSPERRENEPGNRRALATAPEAAPKNKAVSITYAGGSTAARGHDQSFALVPPADDEHDCGWKAYAKHQQAKLDELSAKLATVTAKLDELTLRSKGHQSERRKSKKMPPPVAPKVNPEDTERKRKEGADLRNTKLETELVPVPVPPEACRCPAAQPEAAQRRRRQAVDRV